MIPLISNEQNSIFYIFGPVDENSASDFIENIVNAELNEKSTIEIIINTDGGDITETFAILDVLNYLKRHGVTISTIGLGKVMSAGLILLAAGTEGRRYIGQNARLMFHETWSEHAGGPYNEVKTEFKETKFTQEKYLETLSNITKKEISFYKKYLNKKSNYYFGAEQAIEWGLADHIL